MAFPAVGTHPPHSPHMDRNAIPSQHRPGRRSRVSVMGVSMTFRENARNSWIQRQQQYLYMQQQHQQQPPPPATDQFAAAASSAAATAARADDSPVLQYFMLL